MPLTNPGREGLEGGQTVFIDGPLELPSQLTHQELESLVRLTDLDALQDASHNQIIDTTDVLLTDEMEQMEESDTELGMNTSNQDANHSMDVDCLNNSTAGIAAQLSNLVPLEMALDDSTSSSQISTSSTVQKSTELPMNVLNTSIPQSLKTNSNQFVILQPTQNSSFLSLGGKLVPTGQLLSVNSTANNNKPTINNLQTNTKQFRTLQVKYPAQFSQNSGGITKLIINSQPGNTAQNRITTSQNNVLTTDTLLKPANKNSPSKMAFQFQQIGSPVGQRHVFQAIPKILEHKPSPQLSVPLSFAIRPTSQLSTVIRQDPNERLVQCSTSAATVSSSPQKIFIKGAMPLSLKPGQIIADTQLIKFPSNQISQPQGLPTTNKVNYVRLVSQTASDPSINTTSTMAQAGTRVLNIKKQIVPMSTPGSLCIKPLSMSGSTITSNNAVGAIQVKPPGSLTLPTTALPQQVLSNAQPGSLVMIPAHLLQNNTTSEASSTIQVASQLSPTLPNANKPQPTKTLIDANGIKSRKPCNCTKSQCLKLYCDCFANGEFCNNCNCNNCFNNLKHEEDRQKAIRSCLERNPQAFRPKIGKGGMENKRRHNKGCNCKRSGCLKNYCECYEAKIPCSRICKCVGCRNVDNCQNIERKRLLEIAEATEAKANHKIYIQNKAISLSSMPSPAKMMYPSSGKSTHCRINQEVVAATCHCLLAQAEKASRMGVEENEKQLMVINEFSRCILQIVGGSVNKSKD